MRKNTRVNDPVLIDRKHQEDVKEFTYLGTNMKMTGDCHQEINIRISKANQAFAMKKPVSRTTNLSVHMKINAFTSNVLDVLLNGAESGKTTTAIQRKREVFQTKYLRRIHKNYWPNTISNEEQWNRTGMVTLAEIIQTQRWRWLGHVCRMPSISITRAALRWTPQGKGKRGRPRETWRRTMEKHLNVGGLSLEMAPSAAAIQARWRTFAVASRTWHRREDEWVSDRPTFAFTLWWNMS